MKEKVVTKEEIQFKGEEHDQIAYLSGEDTPFTGKVEDFYANGQKRSEATYKNGKYHGLLSLWYENGQMREEGNYKDGKKVSTVVWNLNGERCPLTNLKDGNGVVARYRNNGQKAYEANYKDGKLDGPWICWYPDGQKMQEIGAMDGKFMSVEVWKPNGEKCPVTNVKDGNGVWIYYNEDGTENYRSTYKDALLVD